MENRCKVDILSLFCTKISVFPFVSDLGLWAELIRGNRGVFADGETGTERWETVVETAPLASKTAHRKGSEPWKRFRLSAFQVCQTTKAPNFCSITGLDHRVPCLFVHRFLHAWTGRHCNSWDFEIVRRHLCCWVSSIKENEEITGDAAPRFSSGALKLCGNSMYCGKGKSGS